MNNIRKYYEKEMKLFSDNYVVNWHEHVWDDGKGHMNEAGCEALYEGACATYMDKVLISCPVVAGDASAATEERCRQVNNVIAEAVKRHPDKYMGMCFVCGGLKDKAVEEVKRCIDMGFVGVKLYHQYVINDPMMYQLVEACIRFDVPILVHAGKLTYQPESQPRISSGQHFADIGRRYPEANFIMAHITGGGDWHWQLKAIADVKNVVTDLSGSVCDNPVVEETVRVLGADRVLFGTDGTLFSCIGKILGSNISVEDKKTILAGKAYDRFIRKAGK